MDIEPVVIVEGISSGKPKGFKVGDRVQVHYPGWTDAAERWHPPIKNHGKIGVVIKRDEHMVGCQRLYTIKFDDGTFEYPHWTNELRRLPDRLEAGTGADTL